MLASSSMRPAQTSIDPVLDAMARAPRVERLTPEQRADLDGAMADIAAGRVVLVADDDVPAWLEARARELGELEE